MTEELLPCTKCGKTKRESEFPRDKRMTGRLFRSSWCNKCHARISNNYYHTHKDNPQRKRKWYRADSASPTAD